MTYSPRAFTTATPFSATDLQANLKGIRSALLLVTTDVLSDIPTEKIVSPRYVKSTDTGYEAYYESGFLVTRNQSSSELRAPAFDGIWTAPAGWTFFDSTTQRPIPAANKPLNGVASRGQINNAAATIYVERKAYVVATINFNIAPMPPAAVVDQLANNPDVLILLLQHKDETGAVAPFEVSINRNQPFVVLDSYLRNHTLRIAGVIEPGWHSFALLSRDPDNEFAYSFIGALQFSVEGWYVADT